MRICIDIDGTICTLRESYQTYLDLTPIQDAAQKIKELRQQGHYIILYTARHMKTCEANVGKVLAIEGYNLFVWLNKQGFEYDEIWFGKPHADLYIDDKALRFEGSWQSIQDKIVDLIKDSL